MTILCTIQDCIYLLWQAELLARNCQDLGGSLTVLIGYSGCPSDYARMLEREHGALLIEDTRTDRSYPPSIQPHLLAKYAPDHHGPALLVDSDLLFRSLDWIPASDGRSVWFSDCASYLNAGYLNGTDPDILGHLCTIATIDPALVADHPAAGGAQYLLPHLFDAAFWSQAEETSNSMYRFMRQYRCSVHPVQVWTASMWAILYGLYKREQAGECTVGAADVLKFCFATDPAHYWYERHILHMAGVTHDLEGHFFKGNYFTRPPWDDDFSHVREDNCSIHYVRAIQRLFPYQVSPI